jgi:hypothetical protein
LHFALSISHSSRVTNRRDFLRSTVPWAVKAAGSPLPLLARPAHPPCGLTHFAARKRAKPVKTSGNTELFPQKNARKSALFGRNSTIFGRVWTLIGHLLRQEREDAISR